MSKRIVLVRHCKASMEGEDKERALDNDGLIQSQSLCKKINSLLKPDSEIYSSPFRRAVESLTPLTKINTNIGIKEVKFLEEIHIEKDANLLNALKKSKNVFKDGISPDKLADIGEAHPGAIMALNGEEMPDS